MGPGASLEAAGNMEEMQPLPGMPPEAHMGQCAEIDPPLFLQPVFCECILHTGSLEKLSKSQ